MAAAVALLFCLVGGLMGLVIGDLFRGPAQPLVPLLLSMLCRMGVPLGLFLLVYRRGGTLANAGFAYYLIGFYLLMLLVDSVMTVSIVYPKDADSNAT
jgi:hypothetical protein